MEPPRYINARTPDEAAYLKATRKDVDELLRRPNPDPEDGFVKEVILPILYVSSGET